MKISNAARAVVQSHINGTKYGTNGTKPDTEALCLIQENPAITQAELKEKMNVSLRTVKRLMSDLQKRGILERQGSNRKGKWVILPPKN